MGNVIDFPGEPPEIKTAQQAIDRLEHAYQFVCEAGPLEGAHEWDVLKAKIRAAIAAAKARDHEAVLAALE